MTSADKPDPRIFPRLTEPAALVRRIGSPGRRACVPAAPVGGRLMTFVMVAAVRAAIAFVRMREPPSVRFVLWGVEFAARATAEAAVEADAH